MAKIKISELETAATLDGTEEIPIVQDGETVKTTAQDIADLGGGGALSIIAKTGDFTANGTSGTVYTNEGAGDTITATLGDSAIGTRYVFARLDANNVFYLLAGVGIDIIAFDAVNNTNRLVNIDEDNSFAISVSGCISVLKITDTAWIVESATSSLNA